MSNSGLSQPPPSRNAVTIIHKVKAQQIPKIDFKKVLYKLYKVHLDRPPSFQRLPNHLPAGLRRRAGLRHLYLRSRPEFESEIYHPEACRPSARSTSIKTRRAPSTSADRNRFTFGGEETRDCRPAPPKPAWAGWFSPAELRRGSRSLYRLPPMVSLLSSINPLFLLSIYLLRRFIRAVAVLGGPLFEVFFSSIENNYFLFVWQVWRYLFDTTY